MKHLLVNQEHLHLNISENVRARKPSPLSCAALTQLLLVTIFTFTHLNLGTPDEPGFARLILPEILRKNFVKRGF